MSDAYSVVETGLRPFPVVIANPETVVSNLSIEVANVATLQGLGTGLTTGTIRRPQGYFTAGDVGMPMYRLETANGRTQNGGTRITSSLAGSLWIAQYTGPLSVTWFGAVPNGVVVCDTAIANAYAEFISSGNRNFVLEFPPGTYKCNQRLLFTDAGNTSSLYYAKTIRAYGAVVTNCVVSSTLSLSIEGLTVKGSPNYGFVILRGQGSLHSNLVARECASHGFYFHGDSADPIIGSPNYQVTRSTFNTCVALGNGGHGWYASGAASANRSWINACTFLSCASLDNAQQGFHVDEGAGPGGPSRFQYNTFLNLNCEGNNTGSPVSGVSIDIMGGQNTFIGGHYADMNTTTNFSALITGNFNFMLGGRAVGNVSDSTFSFINSDFAGASGIISSISGLDYLSATNLDVTGDIRSGRTWTVFPASMVTATAVANSGPHTVAINLTALANSAWIGMRLSIFGRRSATTSEDMCHVEILAQAGKSSTGVITCDFSTQSANLVTNVAAAVSGNVVTFSFNSGNWVAFLYHVCEYRTDSGSLFT